MEKYGFKYGDVVEDSVTGLKGKITAYISYYDMKPTQYYVEGIDSTGRPIEDWIDVYRLHLA